ncbi:MAG: hypothetical protein KAI24_23245, partial [Planctomycetes bacterium]|nr:hypothetical protein [Planctomycetota bacterium]
LNGQIDAGSTAKVQWRQTQGPSVSIENAWRLNAGFTAPQGLGETVTLVFEVTATVDGEAKSDTLTVVVDPQVREGAPTMMLPPVASGEPVALTPRTPVAPDAQVSYEWRQIGGTAVRLEDSGTASPTFEAPQVFLGEMLEFEVVTTDGEQRIVEHVRIRIDPVETLAQKDRELASWQPLADDHEREPEHEEPKRGAGRIWAGIMSLITLRGWRGPWIGR